MKLNKCKGKQTKKRYFSSINQIMAIQLGELLGRWQPSPIEAVAGWQCHVEHVIFSGVIMMLIRLCSLYALNDLTCSKEFQVKSLWSMCCNAPSLGTFQLLLVNIYTALIFKPEQSFMKCTKCSCFPRVINPDILKYFFNIHHN